MALTEQWWSVPLVFSLMICLIYSQDYPNYSKEDLPKTRFSCRNKIDGAYYADVETDCQMYHVCSKVNGTMLSRKFLCGNGTVFDQRHLVCQDYRRVQRCRDSRMYYRNHDNVMDFLEDVMRNEKSSKQITNEAHFEFRRIK